MMRCVNMLAWHCNLESDLGSMMCVRSIAFSLDIRIGVRQDLPSECRFVVTTSSPFDG